MSISTRCVECVNVRKKRKKVFKNRQAVVCMPKQLRQTNYEFRSNHFSHFILRKVLRFEFIDFTSPKRRIIIFDVFYFSPFRPFFALCLVIIALFLLFCFTFLSIIKQKGATKQRPTGMV